MELSEILYQKTNDELYKLAQLCDYRGAKRKDDLVRHLHRTVMTPVLMKQIWGQMDLLSQQAVASAYHNDGEFEPGAFIAQYGSLPERAQGRWSWYYEPIMMDLFIYDGHIPEDVMPLLADVVPPPERFQLQGLKNRPQAIDVDGRAYDLLSAETEQTGLHDLTAFLHLADQGQIRVSSSSTRATIGSIRKVVDNLLEGDFFLLEEKYRAAETIRPYGLDVFVQESKLAKKARDGSHLELTEGGREFYQNQNHEVLLEAFELWTETGRFDELERLSALKGLNASGTRLTKPASRREKVIEALSWCPVDVWIDIEDFYRAVKIWHFDFDVETTHYTNLYVHYKDYGLYGEAYWRLTKGLYINALIWEYLGSIGAVDLLYNEPEVAYFDAHMDYLYSDEPFSLYDGLKYFRINNLGAYLLGQAGEYIPSVKHDPVIFAISDDLTVTLTEPDLVTPYDTSLLEQIAVPLKNGSYRLDTQQMLTALEEGGDLAHLQDFLHNRHSGPLPEAVHHWLETIEQHSQAFKLSGQALLIKVESPALAELVMTDNKLRKFCKRLDDKTLVIPASKERAFRKQLKTLEYILK